MVAVTDGADWPVRRAAMEAILRRCAASEQDGLRVAARPGGGPFGAWATKRPRAPERPYSTWLGGAEPLRASCDCRDFLRNSLGLCKHVLTVLRDLAARKRLDRARTSRPAPFAAARHLSSDPVRPLRGPGDWLARVLVSDGDATRPALAARDAKGPRRRLAAVWRLHAEIASGALPAEPAVVALLRSEATRLEAAHARPVLTRQLAAALASLRQRLYPYQREGVARFLAAGQLLLADDMGLGKTAQAIAACHVLWTTGRVRRGLLIVPARLKPQWVREWALFTDAPVAVVEGRTEERAALYRGTREGFLIANYEQVLRDLEAMHAWAPGLVVLDEAQRIKNWATKTAAYVKRLRPAWRLVLTGTPMENRLDELASLMDWVDDHALEPRWRVAPWHTAWSDGPGGAAGERNLETLRVRLAPSMFRRVRSEVLAQLPPRTDTVVPVELTPEQREEHDALAQPILQLMAVSRRRPLTQAEFLKLMMLLTTQRIVSNGIAQLRFQEVWPAVCERRCPDAALFATMGAPKLRELREIISQVAIGQGRRVVIFSQWRRMLRLAEWAVSDLLVTEGLRAVFFTGAESQRRRTQNIVDFHDDPAVRVLLLTDAGGVGLNLQRAASFLSRIEQIVAPVAVPDLAARRPAESGADPADAAPEGGAAGDAPEVPAAAEDAVADVVPEEEAAAERAIDSLVAAADESSDPVAAEAPAALRAAPDLPGPGREAGVPAAAGARDPAPPAEVVRHLFAGIAVRTTADGGLRIDARPESAATLAAMLEGLAGMLRASAAAPAAEESAGAPR